MTTRSNTPQARRQFAARRGVTLIELLVVLLIISLLATAAAPVLIGRIQEARIVTARAEVEEIAKAEQMVGLFHGVYVPLQILDDLPQPPTGVSSTDSDNVLNSVNVGTVGLILITERASNQVSNQNVMTDTAATDPLGFKILTEWKGPFLNPQRVFQDPGSAPDTGQFRALDHPLDPWGSPYRFISPAGLVGTSADNVDPTGYDSTGFSDGLITSTGKVDPDLFDRYAILSLGPNAVFGPDDTLVNDFGDDIFYVFGIDPNESTFNF